MLLWGAREVGMKESIRAPNPVARFPPLVRCVPALRKDRNRRLSCRVLLTNETLGSLVQRVLTQKDEASVVRGTLPQREATCQVLRFERQLDMRYHGPIS